MLPVTRGRVAFCKTMPSAPVRSIRLPLMTTPVLLAVELESIRMAISWTSRTVQSLTRRFSKYVGFLVSACQRLSRMAALFHLSMPQAAMPRTSWTYSPRRVIPAQTVSTP